MGLVNLFKNILIDKAIKEKIAFLKTCPIFSRLEDFEMRKVYNIMFQKTYPANDLIFEEGKIGKALFFILSGNISILKKRTDNKEKEIAKLHAGDFFGEMALLEELPRSASVKTNEPTKVYLIYKSNFDELISSNPKIGIKIILNIVKILSSRLRNTSASITSETKGD
ncbi:MAG: cyclic nucleotide-binding domain-containing protein [Elusimicrobiota bacterium]